MTPGEKLFKDVISEEDEEFLFRDEKDVKKFKAFTLCMICNPATCGYD